MVRFRDYQLNIIERALKQIKEKGWCYLALQVRTGKTLTALGIVKEMGECRTVFLTKKKAISGIKKDVELIGMEVDVMNYEALHKLDSPGTVCFWILDEAHCLGKLCKPAKKTKLLRDIISSKSKVIFLSGTATPENGSQIFHQMYVLGERSPFYPDNFYRWAAKHCSIYEKRFSYGFPVKCYDRCNFDINSLGLITYSQKEAGFVNEIVEHFLTVDMKPITKRIIETLRKDKVFKGNNDVILADTSVKEMQKIHQLSSGTCLLESGSFVLIDHSKALFVKEYFKGKKYAIFYKFKAELELLKQHLPITEDIERFNNSDDVLALQFIAGREGIKLSAADCLVYFNIDFSATTYWQSRERMTTLDRKISDIYYIVSDCGIERKVYKAVSKKKNFTTRLYERVTDTN